MFDITPMLNQPFGIIASVKNATAKNERYGYEWEKSTTKKEDDHIIKGHILRLQEEVKRMTNNLRIGRFDDPNEKKIFMDRLEKANKDLNMWEEKDRKSRR